MENSITLKFKTTIQKFMKRTIMTVEKDSPLFCNYIKVKTVEFNNYKDDDEKDLVFYDFEDMKIFMTHRKCNYNVF